jgi:calcineurin-like phosphoesterase family protein
MYWFTADEHLGHTNILKHCNRPFKDVDEMDAIIIKNFNKVVTPDDTTVHIGDFTLKGPSVAEGYIERLNGTHIFIKGGHDYWIKDDQPNIIQIWEKEINGIYVVACHYAMTVWPRSHHGSIQLFGHSHGKQKAGPMQMDVGVDAIDSNHRQFYPYSFDEIIKILGIK